MSSRVTCTSTGAEPFPFPFQERDQEIEALSAALEKSKKAEPASRPGPEPQVQPEMPRRSERLNGQVEVARLRAELDQCRSDLSTKTQGEGAAPTRLCPDPGMFVSGG